MNAEMFGLLSRSFSEEQRTEYFSLLLAEHTVDKLPTIAAHRIGCGPSASPGAEFWHIHMRSTVQNERWRRNVGWFHSQFHAVTVQNSKKYCRPSPNTHTHTHETHTHNHTPSHHKAETSLRFFRKAPLTFFKLTISECATPPLSEWIYLHNLLWIISNLCRNCFPLVRLQLGGANKISFTPERNHSCRLHMLLHDFGAQMGVIFPSNTSLWPSRDNQLSLLLCLSIAGRENWLAALVCYCWTPPEGAFLKTRDSQIHLEAILWGEAAHQLVKWDVPRCKSSVFGHFASSVRSSCDLMLSISWFDSIQLGWRQFSGAAGINFTLGVSAVTKKSSILSFRQQDSTTLAAWCLRVNVMHKEVQSSSFWKSPSFGPIWNPKSLECGYQLNNRIIIHPNQEAKQDLWL